MNHPRTNNSAQAQQKSAERKQRQQNRGSAKFRNSGNTHNGGSVSDSGRRNPRNELALTTWHTAAAFHPQPGAMPCFGVPQ